MGTISLLIAVMFGYVLGVTPIVVYFLWKENQKVDKEIRETQLNIAQKQEEKQREIEAKKYENIFTEWLYGKQEEIQNKPNQEEIYKEYITGEAKRE